MMDAPTQTPYTPPPPRNGRPIDQEPVNPAKRAFQEVPVFFTELKSYAIYFLSAKVDGAKASARRVVMLAIMGVIGLLIVGGMLFSAVFLTLGGLAVGLGNLLGGHLWLGSLIVGLIVLSGICVGVWMGVKKVTGAWHLQTEQKYERKRNEQRDQFGRDVRERAGKV